MYTEDISKTNQGGIIHQRRERKQVTHYANDLNPCTTLFSKIIQVVYVEVSGESSRWSILSKAIV